MFNNIGGKIKTLAKVICWLGIIACVICGIVMMIADEDMILFGLLTMIAGSLLSWIGSFLAYGLGELIDNSSKLVALAQKNTTVQ